MRIQDYKCYSQMEDNYWWFVGMRNIFHRFIKNIYKDREDLLILDAGCGTGGVAGDLKEFGSVVGLDAESTALRFCEKKGMKKLIQGNVVFLPFKERTFDLIAAFNVVEHIEDDLSLIKEANRLCKDDGRIIIATSAFNFLWSSHDIVNGHKRRYTKEGLKNIINQHFVVERITYTNFILLPLIWAGIILNNLLRNKYRNLSHGFIAVPKIVNRTLIFVLKVESTLLQKINFPFGVSLLCIARKRQRNG